MLDPVLSTLYNCSFAAFYGGFLFLWPTDCDISWSFFLIGMTRLAFSFFFFFPPDKKKSFFFPRTVIRDILLYPNSGVFFLFLCHRKCCLQVSIYIYIYIYINTLTHKHTYIYIYICVCVCVWVDSTDIRVLI